MIYLHHDFFSNFSAGVKSGDISMTINILNNELSDLVVYDTKQLVEALNKVGISAKESWSDEQIIDVILAQLTENEKLVSAIAFLIADYNKLVIGGDKEGSLKTVNKIAEGLKSISDKLKNDQKQKISMKKDIMDQIVAKANAGGNYNRTIWKSGKRRKTIVYIIGGAVVVGLISYVAYRYVKYKKEQSAVALGLASTLDQGALINPVSPVITPTPQVSPVPTPIANPTLSPTI